MPSLRPADLQREKRGGKMGRSFGEDTPSGRSQTE